MCVELCICESCVFVCVCGDTVHMDVVVLQWLLVSLHSTVYGHESLKINLQAPCILYIGQTYRYSPEYTFYIFSQQIYLIIFFGLSLTIFVYSSTKCRVFPNVTLTLTFRHHASYIQDRRIATPQSTLFIYLVNKYI